MLTRAASLFRPHLPDRSLSLRPSRSLAAPAVFEQAVARPAARSPREKHSEGASSGGKVRMGNLRFHLGSFLFHVPRKVSSDDWTGSSRTSRRRPPPWSRSARRTSRCSTSSSRRTSRNACGSVSGSALSFSPGDTFHQPSAADDRSPFVASRVLRADLLFVRNRRFDLGGLRDSRDSISPRAESEWACLVNNRPSPCHGKSDSSCSTREGRRPYSLADRAADKKREI